MEDPELIELEIKREINEIFNIFYKINPMLNYANKSERLAVEKLITKLGFEKVKRAAAYAVSIQVQKYAPIITKPSQLVNRYGELQAHYAKNMLKKGMNVVKL